MHVAAVHLPAIGTMDSTLQGKIIPGLFLPENVRGKDPKELEGKFQIVKTIFHEKQ